jgi:hypothetical protein
MECAVTTEEVFDDSKFIPVEIPKTENRRSRLLSVFFPDKRASTLVKKTASENNVFDIKAAEKSRTMVEDGQYMYTTTGLKKIDLRPEVQTPTAPASLFRQARGKLSRHLSTFTTSSTATDLEKGIDDQTPQVSQDPIPPLPTMSRLAPGPVGSPAMRSNRLSRLSRELPAINVIPASVPKGVMIEQGDTHVRSASEESVAAHNYRPSLPLGESPDRRLVQAGRKAGRIGLPGNPRPFRRA